MFTFRGLKLVLICNVCKNIFILLEDTTFTSKVDQAKMKKNLDKCVLENVIWFLYGLTQNTEMYSNKYVLNHMHNPITPGQLTTLNSPWKLPLPSVSQRPAVALANKKMMMEIQVRWTRCWT